MKSFKGLRYDLVKQILSEMQNMGFGFVLETFDRSFIPFDPERLLSDDNSRCIFYYGPGDEGVYRSVRDLINGVPFKSKFHSEFRRFDLTPSEKLLRLLDRAEIEMYSL